MSFNIEDMPADVAWVWSIQMAGQPVGLGTYDEIQVIIDKYPKWFAWEHKYKAIPQEVHDAYHKEKDPNWGKPFEEWWPNAGKEDGEEFIGLIPTLMKSKYEPPPEPVKPVSLHQMFMDLAKQEDERRQRQKDEDTRLKALWDKHYSKYGLEYRN